MRSQNSMPEGVQARTLAIIDAPSSLGAYSPGTEKTPAALREIGFHDRLQQTTGAHRIAAFDELRWRPDRDAPRAMNAADTAWAAARVSSFVGRAIKDGDVAVVIGGDCTVGIGSVAGASSLGNSIGLIYADLDVDLQTPETVDDGALDWMGVAHMLALPGCDEALSRVGETIPLLNPDNVFFFGAGNITETERAIIQEKDVSHIDAARVQRDPEACADEALRWAEHFDLVALHFDVDLIDYEAFPLAENTRRKTGLDYAPAMRAIAALAGCPNLAVLTVAEVNPDHDPGGYLSRFAGDLARILSGHGFDPKIGAEV